MPCIVVFACYCFPRLLVLYSLGFNKGVLSVERVDTIIFSTEIVMQDRLWGFPD